MKGYKKCNQHIIFAYEWHFILKNIRYGFILFSLYSLIFIPIKV